MGEAGIDADRQPGTPEQAGEFANTSGGAASPRHRAGNARGPCLFNTTTGREESASDHD